MAFRARRTTSGASVNVSVEGDIDDVIRDLSALQRRLVPRVAAKALNDVTRTMQRRAIDEVAQKLRLPRRLIAKRTRRVSAKVRRPSASLTAYLWGIKVIDLGTARQNAQGTRVRGRQYDHAFIATMPSGDQGVFRRRTKKRLPIKEVTVEVREPFLSATDRLVRLFAPARFAAVFDRELQAAIDKQNQRANARNAR